MKSKLINTELNKKRLYQFRECLNSTGVYKIYGEDFDTRENLIVVCPKPNPCYFGMYDDGQVFPHIDASSRKDMFFERLGDLNITVEIIN